MARFNLKTGNDRVAALKNNLNPFYYSIPMPRTSRHYHNLYKFSPHLLPCSLKKEPGLDLFDNLLSLLINFLAEPVQEREMQ
jgi:hypothetical protein